MESNYNSDNFERLLRESSDQYRMYPSESVWKSVYTALHTRRKWFGFGLLLLMLSAGFVTTIMITNSETAVSKQVSTETKETAPATPTEQLAPQSDNSLPSLYNNNFNTVTRQNFLEPIDNNNRVIENSILINSSFEELSNAGSSVMPIRVEETIAEEESVGNTITFKDEEQLTSAPLDIIISDEATDQNLFFTANKNETKKTLSSGVSLTGFSNYPLSIESVINSYVRKNKKLSFQFYFTPTISYRKLSENKSYLRSATYNPNNTTPLYYDVNKVVTHKPDMGVEVGIAARYAISKKMKLRAGLQFNTSRYDIKAFRSATEVTTIALNTGNFTADSVNTLSNYRNFNGYKSDWLHNLYFQIAAPVGVELQLAGDSRIKFGIAGTVQPTYILGDKVYMISTNYKNYAEVPSLIRRWNVNTSFEAFVGYSTGRMNWQVGPQVRYQMMSSFVKEYPVKENLFDFGLKIGVSANR